MFVCILKQQEKLHAAAEVILGSSMSIVSSSSNMDFRNACLNRMKVWKNCLSHGVMQNLNTVFRGVDNMLGLCLSGT